MNERDFAELAAGHALGALSDADERRFLDALAAHPEWSAIAEDDLDTASALAEALGDAPPPRAVREQLLARVASTPQTGQPPAGGAPVAPGERRARPERTRWRRMLFTLAAGIALLAGAGVAATAIVAQLQRPASVVALDEIRSAPDAEQTEVRLESGAIATAHWSGELGKAVLVASGLDDLGEERTYELWFVRGETPIAAGVFDAEDGRATALLDVPMHEGDVIAVTVEQAGGSPSGAPTTEPIIVIPTA